MKSGASFAQCVLHRSCSPARDSQTQQPRASQTQQLPLIDTHRTEDCMGTFFPSNARGLFSTLSRVCFGSRTRTWQIAKPQSPTGRRWDFASALELGLGRFLPKNLGRREGLALDPAEGQRFDSNTGFKKRHSGLRGRLKGNNGPREDEPYAAGDDLRDPVRQNIHQGDTRCCLRCDKRRISACEKHLYRSKLPLRTRPHDNFRVRGGAICCGYHKVLRTNPQSQRKESN
jgi:hypothetical protein